jgi:hypothetical protein
MKKKSKCLYTNMLNRLSILDDQIYEMQASLAKVREWVAEKIDTPSEEENTHNEEPGE